MPYIYTTGDDVTRVVSQPEQAHVIDDPFFFHIYNHAAI